ncbi:putative bifunctional diguanylate cyclase/phosphodiesterase [Herminiimonas aquatilis]|uniref:Bifunctional diguanylate cyclase/phosphodiesterase n=1 Tax=Herminiimonas aquatilis TaxID=345342 RepID=A0ABW2J3P5_9BURK
MKFDKRRLRALTPAISKDIQRRQEHTLRMREHEVSLREEWATVREREISEAQTHAATYGDSNLQLRAANEHLVIASIQSHIMAEMLEKSRAEMSHLANHDFLTDLPNRMQLYDRISLAIASAKRNGIKLTIMFVDLDRFKVVNDSFGHVVGDQLLQAVAQRLTSTVRDSDTVSRPGGDEFVLLLPDAGDENLLVPIIEKIHAAITAPYTIEGNDVDIGATIGVSIFPEDGNDVETLIHCADAAMYHAKEGGRNTYQFFRKEMRGRNTKLQDKEEQLLEALARQQFVLFYQAQINLESGAITGVEALIRWRHPERGLLLPESFIQDAEDCGAIVAIGRWVLLEACNQAQAWLDEGLIFNMMAVNVSAHQFANNDFLENVQSVLQQSGWTPNRLELELNESVLLKNIASATITLHALRSIGVKIAIDDFGTGCSSMIYLKQLAVDTMKIDRSFVHDISSSEDDILVRAIIGIGKGFRHRIIAEGVETAEQLAILRDIDCSTAQGYYLNRPMIAEEFADFLKAGVAEHLLKRQGMPGDPVE